MSSENIFFDELKKRAETLHENPKRDNEASRHDLLIHPLLTNPHGLEWDPIDLIPQHTIIVPPNVAESYILRNAVLKNRRPDILIRPLIVGKNIAVIEEKKRQDNILKLNDHRFQISEYLALYECIWGILTDGEKWIIKKNFETFHEFSSLDELQSGIHDLREAIGKKAVISRITNHKTCDIVICVPSVVTVETTIEHKTTQDKKLKIRFGKQKNIEMVKVSKSAIENMLGYNEKNKYDKMMEEHNKARKMMEEHDKARKMMEEHDKAREMMEERNKIRKMMEER